MRNVATAELKKDEDGLNELLRERGWTSAYYSANELQTGDSVPTPSEAVRKHIGVESVCEKAAMLLQFEPEIVNVNDAWVFTAKNRPGHQVLIFIRYGPDRYQVNILLRF